MARIDLGLPDAHFGFSLMLEAAHREWAGLDSTAPLQEAELNFQKLFSVYPEQRNNFFPRMILGEVHLLRAEILHRKQRNASPWIERALAELRVAVEKDPAAAYPYYRLPRAHALAARLAIESRQDASPSLKAALAAAARGIAINPRNAQIQQAVADAHLADGQARAAAGRDPGPALEAARRALEAADAVNPRDFRSFLLRAEVEKAAAAFVRAQGGDPAKEVARMELACRRGLRIKGDERRFRALLAEAKASPTAKAPGTSGASVDSGVENPEKPNRMAGWAGWKKPGRLAHGSPSSLGLRPPANRAGLLPSCIRKDQSHRKGAKTPRNEDGEFDLLRGGAVRPPGAGAAIALLGVLAVGESHSLIANP